MNNTLEKKDLQEFNFCFWLKSNKNKMNKIVLFAENKEKAEALGFQKLIEKNIDKNDLAMFNTPSISRRNNKYSSQRESLCVSMRQATRMNYNNDNQLDDYLLD